MPVIARRPCVPRRLAAMSRLPSSQSADRADSRCEAERAAREHPAARHARSAYRSSFTPFLPATVLRGPFRVRALVRVRCPRTGSPLRWRKPR